MPTTSPAEPLRLPNYTAYLVRLWRDSPQAPWRASAQCASTGEKVMFASLEELFAFLLLQTSVSLPTINAEDLLQSDSVAAEKQE